MYTDSAATHIFKKSGSDWQLWVELSRQTREATYVSLEASKFAAARGVTSRATGVARNNQNTRHSAESSGTDKPEGQDIQQGVGSAIGNMLNGILK